jgi:hypothetical protein
VTELKPDKLNERFTLYLNAEGKLVERTLREMKAADALAAIEWHANEVNPLEREAAPFSAMGEILVEAMLLGKVVPDPAAAAEISKGFKRIAKTTRAQNQAPHRQRERI